MNAHGNDHRRDPLCGARRIGPARRLSPTMSVDIFWRLKPFRSAAISRRYKFRLKYKIGGVPEVFLIDMDAQELAGVVIVWRGRSGRFSNQLAPIITKMLEEPAWEVG